MGGILLRFGAALRVVAVGLPLSGAARAAETPLPVPRPAAAGPPPTEVPLPIPRPEVQGPPLPARPGPAPPDAAAPSPPDPACERLLASGKVEARREPPRIGPSGCGIATPLTLLAIRMPDGRSVPFMPPPLLRCDLAAALADWVRDDLGPAAAPEGGVVALADAAAYECRSRNREPGAPLSEHATGNAIDLVGIRFARRAIALKQADAHDIWTTVKTTACTRFATVLGPGSDGYHEAHLHLDLKPRRNGARLCHWDDP